MNRNKTNHFCKYTGISQTGIWILSCRSVASALKKIRMGAIYTVLPVQHGAPTTTYCTCNYRWCIWEQQSYDITRTADTFMIFIE